MKAGLHRFMSFAMVLLLLVSTTSWTVGSHYCMGRLMDVSFFEHPEGCGMDMTGGEDDGKFGLEYDDGCCEDELVGFQGQDDLKTPFHKVTLDQQVFQSTRESNFFTFRPLREKLPVNEYYPPPLLVKDIQLLDEVFLI